MWRNQNSFSNKLKKKTNDLPVCQFCSFRAYNPSDFSYSITALGVAIGLNLVLGTVLFLQVGYHLGTSPRDRLVLKCLVYALATFEVAQTGMHFSVHLCTYFLCCTLMHLPGSSGNSIYRGHGADPLSCVIPLMENFCVCSSFLSLLRTESRTFVGAYSTIRLLNLPASSAAHGPSLQLPFSLLIYHSPSRPNHCGVIFLSVRDLTPIPLPV